MKREEKSDLLSHNQHGELLTIELEGEIDHCSAQSIRDEIELLLSSESIKRMRLDFTGVTFMDSSGIGMLIGRYKTMVSKGGTIEVCHLNPQVEKVFRLSGLHRIMNILPSGGAYEA